MSANQDYDSATKPELLTKAHGQAALPAPPQSYWMVMEPQCLLVASGAGARKGNGPFFVKTQIALYCVTWVQVQREAADIGVLRVHK